MISQVLIEGFKDRLGKNIAHCRERAQLSQEDLGLRAALHRTEISQLERGLRVLRADTMLARYTHAVGGSFGVVREAVEFSHAT